MKLTSNYSLLISRVLMAILATLVFQDQKGRRDPKARLVPQGGQDLMAIVESRAHRESRDHAEGE